MCVVGAVALTIPAQHIADAGVFVYVAPCRAVIWPTVTFDLGLNPKPYSSAHVGAQ